MKRYSIIIMGHTSRSQWFPYLREKLGDVPFSIDTGKPGDAENIGLWNNCKRAWFMGDDSEWTFVIQEDSIICKDFYEKLDKVLNSVDEKDFIISLYAGERYKNKALSAIKQGRPYVLGNHIWNENCLGMRTKHVKEMIDYCDMRGATTDRFIQTYARKKGLLIYAPIPSLCDHRPDPSLYRELYQKGYIDTPRQAVLFSDNTTPLDKINK